MRLPLAVIKTYRALQIVLNDLNAATANGFLEVVLNYSIMAILILCIFVLLGFKRKLGVGASVVFTSGIVGSLSVSLLSYIKLGEINTRSKGVLDSWARYGGYQNTSEKKLMLTYVRSSQPLKVHFGSFEYYTVSNALPKIGKLIYYITKFILMTKHLR